MMIEKICTWLIRNKTGAYKEMREKDTKFIAIVMDKVFDIE